MLYKKLFLLLSLLLITFKQDYCSAGYSLALNQDAVINPVRFKVSNQLNELLITLNIDDNWHVYANYGAGYPFTVEIAKSTNLAKHRVHFPEAIKLESGNSQDATYVYENFAQIKIKLEPVDLNKPIEVELSLTYGACNNICGIFDEKIHYVISADSLMKSIPDDSLKEFILMILFAIVGGFILNFMPCVLPVLSIKILGIIKSKKFDHHVTKKELFFTVIGMISTFLALAVFVTLLRQLGQNVGWGMHFHEPIFLMILIIILIIFANNLWNEFGSNIRLPANFLNKLLSTSERNIAYFSSFLTGVLATLLATPCLAPFISTSVAFAITQKPITIFLVYGSIGLGMGLPYILMILVPQTLKFFPKPGRWMIVFKKIMALSLLGTAFWLLYVLFHQITVKSFLLFLAIVIISKALLLQLMQKRKILLLLVIPLLLLAIMAPFYANKFEHKKDLVLDSLWMQYNREGIENAVQQNKVVLLDVTASWCINCHYNKYFVLENDDVIEFLKQNHVVLMRADYTKRSKEIASLLSIYNRPGIPLNLIYCANYPEGIALPEILSAKDVVNAVKSCLATPR